jgi:hypothetical protein
MTTADNVIQLADWRLQKRIAKLHPDRHRTLETLKRVYPNESQEELLQEMKDWGF